MRLTVLPLTMLVLALGSPVAVDAGGVLPATDPGAAATLSTGHALGSGMAVAQSREAESYLYFLFDVSKSFHTADGRSRLVANLPLFEQTVWSWWNQQQYYRYPLRVFVGTIGSSSAVQAPVCDFPVAERCPLCPRRQQVSDSTNLVNAVQACKQRLTELPPEDYTDIGSAVKSAALNMLTQTDVFRGILIISDLASDPPPGVPPAVLDLENICVGIRVDANPNASAARDPQDIDRRLLLRLDLLRWRATDSRYWFAAYTPDLLGQFFQRCEYIIRTGGAPADGGDALRREGEREAERLIVGAEDALQAEQVDEAEQWISSADAVLSRLDRDGVTAQLRDRLAAARELLRIIRARVGEGRADALRGRAAEAIANGRVGVAVGLLDSARDTLNAAADPRTENGAEVAGRIARVQRAIDEAIRVREAEADEDVGEAADAIAEEDIPAAAGHLDDAEVALRRGGGPLSPNGRVIERRIEALRDTIIVIIGDGFERTAEKFRDWAVKALGERRLGAAAEYVREAEAALANASSPLSENGIRVAGLIETTRTQVRAAIEEAESRADELTQTATESLAAGRIGEASDSLREAETEITSVGRALSADGARVEGRIQVLRGEIRAAVTDAETKADSLTDAAEGVRGSGRLDEADQSLDEAERTLVSLGSTLTDNGRETLERTVQVRLSVEESRFRQEVLLVGAQVRDAQAEKDFGRAIELLVALQQRANAAPEPLRPRLLGVLDTFQVSSWIQTLTQCLGEPDGPGCQPR